MCGVFCPVRFFVVGERFPGLGEAKVGFGVDGCDDGKMIRRERSESGPGGAETMNVGRDGSDIR